MNFQLIPDPGPRTLAPEVAASFRGNRLNCFIVGPARLVRIGQLGGIGMGGNMLEGSVIAGRFWFSESFLKSLQAWAHKDLRDQGALKPGHQSFVVKIELRQRLAICKDFTENLDVYSVLSIPAGKRMAVTIGVVAEQPAYSPTSPNHMTSESGGVRFEGGARQIVIDFSHPANIDAKSWIRGPFSL